MPAELCKALIGMGDTLNYIEEIRVRRDKPLTVIYGGKELYVNSEGLCGRENALRPTGELIAKFMAAMCEYSPYAYNEQIRRGYITLEGGFRVGLVGTGVIGNGTIATIKYITSMNIRIAREVKGCADRVIEHIRGSTMLISPPACGKTTLLRDIVRQLSNRQRNVGVVDERGELSGTYQGCAQLDLGERTDVMCGCGKAEGMMLLLRTMAPDIIAVDEIGTRADIEGIRRALSCGVDIICTLHALGIEDLLKKPDISELAEQGLFNRYIVLSDRLGAGTVENIYDGEMNVIC
jgi:stage III sporulation protein AA